MLRRLAARAARRRRCRRASTADVFVRSSAARGRRRVRQDRILPAVPARARVDGSGANLLLKECPCRLLLADQILHGPGNDYKFAILRDGAYFCHGGKGSWYDLRLACPSVPSSLEEVHPRAAALGRYTEAGRRDRRAVSRRALRRARE